MILSDQILLEVLESQRSPFVPAKAGTQGFQGLVSEQVVLDFRLRGNERNRLARNRWTTA
jgi:hypothetical protein